MSAYLITYDLNSPGQNYEDLIQTIKDLSIYWCHYWKSAYLIKSNLSASQIVDKIKPYLDGNDCLIVVEANPKNYQGWLSEKDWEFIRKHIFD